MSGVNRQVLWLVCAADSLLLLLLLPMPRAGGLFALLLWGEVLAHSILMCNKISRLQFSQDPEEGFLHEGAATVRLRVQLLFLTAHVYTTADLASHRGFGVVPVRGNDQPFHFHGKPEGGQGVLLCGGVVLVDRDQQSCLCRQHV